VRPRPRDAVMAGSIKNFRARTARSHPGSAPRLKQPRIGKMRCSCAWSAHYQTPPSNSTDYNARSKAVSINPSANRGLGDKKLNYLIFNDLQTRQPPLVPRTNASDAAIRGWHSNQNSQAPNSSLQAKNGALRNKKLTTRPGPEGGRFLIPPNPFVILNLA